MQGKESSSHAKTRDELMYWRNLNPLFKVDLHGNFRSSLEIPLYFTENVKGKLPHKVVLKGPNVDLDAWEVQLKTSNNTTWFVGDGWNDFVGAFSLEENDTLVFKYKNNSYFKVTVISWKTSCERESSHFVMKSVSKRGKKESNALALKQETKSEEEKRRGCDDQYSLSRSPMVEKRLVCSDSDDDDPLPLSSRYNTRNYTGSNVYNRNPKPLNSLSPRNVEMKTESEVDCNSSPSPLHSLCSREQTTKEIRRARQRAEEIQRFRKDSFFVALSRSHVNGNMKLGIPKQWWNAVVKSKCDKCMKIRIKGEVEYDQQLYFCSYDESKCTATITTGWKKFVQTNSLYEYDCCVFGLAKPLEENYEFIHMEVEIIRAIFSRKIEPS